MINVEDIIAKKCEVTYQSILTRANKVLIKIIYNIKGIFL